MRYAQLVVGPAGSGKSTYCSTIVKHGAATKREVKVINLDPAAEYFDYDPTVDIRELIHLDDVMEDPELHFGPNGGLVFCMEYLMKNTEWLEEELGDIDDDYMLFDCPGQMELYTHMNLFRQFVDLLQHWNFRICAIFLLDSQFMTDSAKFISGTMAALSVMINLEVPHFNIITKMDLLSKSSKRQLDRFIEPNSESLLENSEDSNWSTKYRSLTTAISRLIDDFSLVRFFTLDINDEENISDLLVSIDNILQYGEDVDVKTVDFEEPDREEDG